MSQYELDFEGGLIDQFPQWRDCIRASVYSCGRPFKSIAADLDMSVSELSRKLADNPNDPVHFPANRLPELIHATGDLRPVYWLVERFLEDDEAKRRRAIDRISKLVPELEQLMRTIR